MGASCSTRASDCIEAECVRSGALCFKADLAQRSPTGANMFAPFDIVSPGPSCSVPRDVVTAQMGMFELAYNADEIARAASVYAHDCVVTVNGGVENGGPFTGHTPHEVAAFLTSLRNNMGGTNMKFAITRIEGPVHEDVWVADSGAGSCRAVWEQRGSQWFIARDEITFKPNAVETAFRSGDVPLAIVVSQMKVFEDAYNADDTTKCACVYAANCLVTVNGGTENGGPFTGHKPSEVAAFLHGLRNSMGGTGMRFAITQIEGVVHHDVWVADNGAGSCRAVWEKQNGQWLIVRDEISFTPKVAPSSAPKSVEIPRGALPSQV